MSKSWLYAPVVICVLLCASLAFAQSAAKPLTNDDVIAMVKGGLPEGTIINAINAQPSTFDVSAMALLGLKKQGVNGKIMDAMIAASNKPAAAAAPAAPAASAVAAATPGQPAVLLITGAPLPVSHTQIVQTKNKANTLDALSSDAVIGQAVQQVGMAAAQQAVWRSGSYTGGAAMGAAGSAISGLSKLRKPTVTYVWAVPGPKGETLLEASQASFNVNFAGIPGVNADEYEPVIAKLATSPNNVRLVGATQAKQDVFESNTMDWQVYSNYIEQRIPATATKTASGQYTLAPTAPLPAGEYGVVLRPFNKDKKFGASTVSQNSGEGIMFNSVWAFSVK